MGRPDEPLGRSVPIRVQGLGHDVAAICPGLALRKDGSLMQRGWALERVGDELPVGATKLGGEPDLPDDTRWPTHHDDRPLAFVAQIALADLAAAGAGGLPAGLLSFFSRSTRRCRAAACCTAATAWRSGVARYRARCSEARGWTLLRSAQRSS